MSNAIDTPSKVTATAAETLVKLGYTHVGRYLAEGPWAWKGLTADEANTIKSAGLQIISIFEKGPTSVSYFTADQAKKDAADAMKWAKNVGQPEGTAIYFTVDYDAQPGDFPAILNYFKVIKDNLKGYVIGAYGSYAVISFLQSQNVAKYLMQTYAWSSGKHCDCIHIFQYQCDKKLAGLDVDLNNLEQLDVGAWGQTISATATTQGSGAIGNVKVICDDLNLRTAPSTSASIIRKLNNGEKYKYYAEQNGWYNLGSGWAYGNNGQYLQEYDLGQIGIVTVTADILNVRQNPNTSSAIVEQLPKGTAFKCYDFKNGWYNVGPGWVSGDFVTFKPV